MIATVPRTVKVLEKTKLSIDKTLPEMALPTFPAGNAGQVPWGIAAVMCHVLFVTHDSQFHYQTIPQSPASAFLAADEENWSILLSRVALQQKLKRGPRRPRPSASDGAFLRKC